MMYLLILLACFPEISTSEENRFPENPNHNYDGDDFGDAEDCDDSNPDIGLPQWYYKDADGDGFGVQADSHLWCPDEKEEGYILAVVRNDVEVFDCNDDPENEGWLVHPDALEVCDELDNDCNGQVDEVDSLQTKPWYRDNDGDGYGYFDPDDEENSIVFSCIEYPGLVQNILDCDDTTDEISPDAVEQCDGIDNNCNGAIDEPTAEDVVKWYRDADEDGFGSDVIFVEACTAPEGYIDVNGQPFDCNDNDEEVFPDAVEVCDGVDNNCNVLIDEGADSTAPDGASTFYADFDGDGFGNVNVTTVQCSQPNGYVTNIDDCNDGNAQIHPNADEYCNAVDDNCNGQLDEGSGSSAPVDASTWYIDIDGDLSGSISATLLQCAQPSGYVGNMDDCDDTDAGLNNIDSDGDGLSTCDGDCNDADPSASSGDMDGDGQTSCNGDCDDSNPNVYLGAPELCNNFLDDDCDGQIDESDAVDKTEWFEDLDGDGFGNGSVSQLSCTPPSGYVDQFGDCNDNNDLISPAADEVCDGADNNCDGLIDDADANLDLNTATEFFHDDDVDGQGDPNDSVFRCTVPPGFVTNNTDCDDTNDARYLGALEYCNGLDDDCDGTEDESAEDAIDYYVDADGDEHGAMANSPVEVRCPEYDPITSLPLHPAGLAPSNDDCDDTDATISPSADELCSNDIDENCDTHNTAGATNVSTFVVDADGDGFGSGETDTNGNLAYALELCVEPFGYVLYEQGDFLDCDDGDFATKPGAQEKCNGKRDNCPADGDNSVPVDEWDDDGDGYVECTIDAGFLFNADGSVNGWKSNQTVYDGVDCDDTDGDRYPFAFEKCNGIFDHCDDPDFSNLNPPDLEDDGDGDGYVECTGFDSNDWYGASSVIGGDDCNDASVLTKPGGAPMTDATACLTDADGDGYSDRLWSICPTSQGLSDARFTFEAEGLYNSIGYSNSVSGDVDGDGLDDILIASHTIGTSAGNTVGKVYLFFGSSLSVDGSFDVSNADYIFEGEQSYDRFGFAISMAGDVDRDGRDDILIGAYGNDDVASSAGKSYLFLGGNLTSGGTLSASTADYTFLGEEAYDEAGWALSLGGDVDGDGFDDILIGAYGNETNGTDSGKTYLILGSSLGGNTTIDLASADYAFVGEQAEDYSGSALSFGGDIDDDGLTDIVIGAYGHGFQNLGKIYLIFGSSLTTPSTFNLSQADYVFLGTAYNEQAGVSISTHGDVDGDGLDDILIGADRNSTDVTYGGKTYLILGSSLGGDTTLDLTTADYILQGQESDYSGRRVHLGGDLDNDGLDEVFVSTRRHNQGTNISGGSYAVLGSSLGVNPMIDLTSADFMFVGDNDGSESIMNIFNVGDIDGDGNVEVLTGMPYDDSVGPDAGRIAIFSACEN